MTNISKNILDSKTESKLRKQFSKFFSDQIPSELENLFSDLLTQSEQIMLIKRLAVIVLLIEGQSIYSIPKTLQMSVSTVRDIKSKYKLGKYDKANQYITMAIRTNSKNPVLLFQTGLIKKKAGDSFNGTQFIKRALQTNPYLSELLQWEMKPVYASK